MPVSYENSKAIYEGIRSSGIRSLSALPETWLGLLLQRAKDDPEMSLVLVAKEEEAVGVAASAWFAGTPHALLMQNHGLLAAINGIVSWPSSTASPSACWWRSVATGGSPSVAHPRGVGAEDQPPASPSTR